MSKIMTIYICIRIVLYNKYVVWYCTYLINAVLYSHGKNEEIISNTISVFSDYL